MNVENIRLINFRNYKSINIDFNKNINVFIGKNAQGKTNLLEAIYLCSTGKSFRTNRDRELINFHKNEAYVGSNVRVGGFNKFIEIKLNREGPKIIRLNKNELKNNKELYSGLNIVVFSPDDLVLIKGSPQERRDFIDSIISQIKPVYSYNINKYNKVLYQRNSLLKSNKYGSDLNNLLDIFDVQIAKLGTSILIQRKIYIDELQKISRVNHSSLTSEKESFSIKYSTNVALTDDKNMVEKTYIRLLKENRMRDMECRTTEIGPHRDDLLIYIDDNEVKTYGSQGQQRTATLTLKLSEVDIIKNERGEYPVLLLDDVLSELDVERRSYLTKAFNKMQTFITITDAIDIKSLEGYNKSIFYIADGRLIIDKNSKDFKQP